MSTFTTVNYTELTDSIEKMVAVGDSTAVLSEIATSVVSMTQLTDATSTFTEYTQTDRVGYELGVEKTAEIDSNVIDYDISVAGMWDWKFILTGWNDIGNKWDESWAVISPPGAPG